MNKRRQLINRTVIRRTSQLLSLIEQHVTNEEVFFQTYIEAKVPIRLSNAKKARYQALKKSCSTLLAYLQEKNY